MPIIWELGVDKRRGRERVSTYAGRTGEALPWWLVLVEGVLVALLGLLLLVAPGASLFFIVQLLGLYLFIAGIFRIIGIFLDSSSWGLKLLGLAHPPGLLLCRRFPTHPKRLNHRSHTPNEHEDPQDKR